MLQECLIKLTGNTKDIIKFMVENMRFVCVGKNGIQFISEISITPNVFVRCNEFKIDIIKGENIVYDEELDSYIELTDEDDRPNKLYSFVIVNDYNYVIIKKSVFRGNYFEPDTIVNDKLDFMSEFFKDFYIENRFERKDIRKLTDLAIVNIKVLTHEIPIDTVESWRKTYNLNTEVEFIDEEKQEIISYTQFADDEQEIQFSILNLEEKQDYYVSRLAKLNMLDIYNVKNVICEMLYSIKDKLPFEVDLEQTDQGRFKYNKTICDITSMLHSLSRNDPWQLSKLYFGIANVYSKITGDKEKVKEGIQIQPSISRELI